MTYNEILSAAQSLSETERQSLVQALSVGNQCEATVPESSRLSALLEKTGQLSSLWKQALLPFR